MLYSSTPNNIPLLKVYRRQLGTSFLASIDCLSSLSKCLYRPVCFDRPSVVQFYIGHPID
jgi:hypothetical protein